MSLLNLLSSFGVLLVTDCNQTAELQQQLQDAIKEHGPLFSHEKVLQVPAGDLVLLLNTNYSQNKIFQRDNVFVIITGCPLDARGTPVPLEEVAALTAQGIENVAAFHGKWCVLRVDCSAKERVVISLVKDALGMSSALVGVLDVGQGKDSAEGQQKLSKEQEGNGEGNLLPETTCSFSGSVAPLCLATITPQDALLGDPEKSVWKKLRFVELSPALFQSVTVAKETMKFSSAPIVGGQSAPAERIFAVYGRRRREALEPPEKEDVAAVNEESLDKLDKALFQAVSDELGSCMSLTPHLLTSQSASTTICPCAACKSEDLPPCDVAVLFSGGVDSAVIAAYAAKALCGKQPIELINVAFEANGESFEDAPDRKAAVECFKQLVAAFPGQEFRFVRVDVPADELARVARIATASSYPANSVMDESISVPMWEAINGAGSAVLQNGKSYPFYHSRAKIVLLGQGADEQFGGYRRARIAFTHGWEAVQRELEKDFTRLWARNNGRDHRVLGKHAKFCLYPFLVCCVATHNHFAALGRKGHERGRGDPPLAHLEFQVLRRRRR